MAVTVERCPRSFSCALERGCAKFGPNGSDISIGSLQGTAPEEPGRLRKRKMHRPSTCHGTKRSGDNPFSSTYGDVATLRSTELLLGDGTFNSSASSCISRTHGCATTLGQEKLLRGLATRKTPKHTLPCCREVPPCELSRCCSCVSRAILVIPSSFFTFTMVHFPGRRQREDLVSSQSLSRFSSISN